MPVESPWTDEQVDTLKDLWSQGLSAGEIARTMAGGYTRNAIIGKVHRLKLEKRAKVVTRKQRSAGSASAQAIKATKGGRKGQPKVQAIVHRVAAIKAAPPPPKPVGVRLPPRDPSDYETDVGVDVSSLIGIMDLTNHTCRYPHGDPLKEGFGFCGKHIRQGSVYCEHHHRRVYPARAPL